MQILKDILWCLLVISLCGSGVSRQSILTEYERDAPRVDYSQQMNYSYSRAEAEVALWLSAATYCSEDTFRSRVFQGPSHGFAVSHVISDQDTGTVGYIGYLNRNHRIYVVFRGTHSIDNFFTDIQLSQVRYSTYPDCNCMVHDGFFKAEQSVISYVIRTVQSLQNTTGYGVTIAGHSLGGALAHLAALDFLRVGITPSVYTFGQPRVGDIAFANLLTTLPAARRVYSEPGCSILWRLTHYKDMIPHLPVGNSYYHSCREVYENRNDTSTRVCSMNDCQDLTCSMQFYVAETDISDHHIYLGLPLTCDAVS